MEEKVQVSCTKCGTTYEVDAGHGGRMGCCFRCGNRFIVPIPCPIQLISWAKATTWNLLNQFVISNGAAGHAPPTVDRLIEIHTRARWIEEHRIIRESSTTGRSFTRREEQWNRTNRIVRHRSLLDGLISMSPKDFEKIIAEIYSSKGMTTKVVGGSNDDGIDVKILDQAGRLLAVAQCKKYAIENKVGSSEIREFVGAYEYSGARTGLFFTTSSFSSPAMAFASHFDWLELYDGQKLIELIEEIEYEIR